MPSEESLRKAKEWDQKWLMYLLADEMEDLAALLDSVREEQDECWRKRGHIDGKGGCFYSDRERMVRADTLDEVKRIVEAVRNALMTEKRFYATYDNACAEILRWLEEMSK